MIEMIEINLTKLLKADLNINEYLTLLKLHLLAKGQNISFKSSAEYLTSLVTKGYLKTDKDTVSFTPKGVKLFTEVANVVGEKEFDELFELYPVKTPSGRVLRCKSKEIMGKYTRDYETLRNKYIKAVRKLDDHALVLEATQNMIYDYKRRGSTEFYQKMETYINQRGWEKYIGVSIIEISENVDRI